MSGRNFRHVDEEKGFTNDFVKADKSSRQENHVLAKQAILRELNKDLSLRAERIKLQSKKVVNVISNEGVEKGAGDAFSTTVIVQSKTFDSFEKDRPQKNSTPSKIPTSNARIRRREIKEKSSHIDVRNYRPGYTWNRGGRLKELRIRYIARKFLYRWMKNVFGRVLPSTALQHYKRIIIRKVFDAWYDDWWEVRQEWRLLIRAECHYRYVVWGRIIAAWKEYVYLCRVRNAKMCKAKSHYNNTILSKVSIAWKTYILHQKHSKKKSQIALRQRQEVLVRNAWRKWLAEMSNCDHYREMDSIALQFWSYRLQAEHWFIWIEKFQNRLKEKQKMELASRYHQQSLKKTCLTKWLGYHKQRRVKKSNLDYGSQLYQVSLKIRYLKYWRERLRFKRSHASLELQILNSGKTFQTRRYLERWKKFVDKKKTERAKLQHADLFYIRHLLGYGFNAFRLNSVQARIQRMRNTMATQLHYRHVINEYWNVWLNRCERNEELDLLPLTSKARKHHGRILLSKCFKALNNYKEWRNHRKAQYTRADTHYYLHELPKYMFYMKVFVQVSKTEKENKVKSQQFYRESVLSRFFCFWSNSTEQSKENRLSERMAILHYDGTVLHRFFENWKLRTVEVLEDQVKEEQAVEHSCWTNCQKHFQAWRDHVRDVKKSEQNEGKAVQHRYQCLIKQHFKQWRQYHASRQEKTRLKEKADKYYKKKVCRLMFIHLKLYIQQTRQINTAVKNRYQVKCQQLKSMTLKQWYKNAKEEKEERCKDNTADLHHNIHLIHRVFTTWHRYAVIHSFKKTESNKLELEAREHLKRVIVKQCFNKWCAAKDRNILIKLRLQQAAQHHENKTCEKVIKAWIESTQLSRRKNLLARQSQWFYNVRLTAKYYLLWKQYLIEAEKTQEKTHIALWHWSLNLQKKVVEVWIQYIGERKRKKERIATAMSNRRARLLRNGVSQWLNVADDLSKMRSKFAAEQQAKTAYDRYQLLQKYALHWKHVTIKNIRIRGGPRPLTIKDPSKELAVNQLKHILPSREPPSIFPASSRYSDLPALKMASASPCLPLDSRKTTSENVQYQEPSQLIRQRPKPRRPAFLVDSLKKAGLFSSLIDNSPQICEEENEDGEDNVRPDHVQPASNLVENVVREQMVSVVASPSNHAVSSNQRHLELSPPENNQSTPQNVTQNSQYAEGRCSISPSNQYSLTVEQRILHSSPLSGRHDLRQSTLALSTLSGGHDTLRLETNEITLLKPGDFMKSLNSDKEGSVSVSQENAPTEREREKDMTCHEELIYIRNTLKILEEDQKRLKSLQKQCKHLSRWLKDDVKIDDDDIDEQEVQHELLEVKKEIAVLKDSVGKDKIKCQRLVERSKILVSLLQT
ncbi:protein SFI1 homolog [Patella vulgata]|uniref:protein SFI1 homolog n=1 Tax=Patella vulgata TaxID=6465 RepID=UPI0021808D5F|nr:protein SFI1 homolog [Patella vulgata]